jgi:hypothetical protein
MATFSKTITAADAAKAIIGIVERDVVFLREGDEPAVIGKTRSGRYIGLFEDDGEFVLVVSDGMMSSEHFWAEIFGNLRKAEFGFDTKHTLLVETDESFEKLVDSEDDLVESEIEMLFTFICAALQLPAVHARKDIEEWKQKLRPLRKYVDSDVFDSVIREEYFQIGSSLHTAIRRLAEASVTETAKKWAAECGLPDPQRPRRLPKAKMAAAEKPKKAAPRRHTRSTK